MATNVEPGDKVSWNWNGNQPSGTVGEVKAGEVSVTSHRGNEIKKTGDEENPAVHIERPGNDVVKKASELNIDEKASGGDKINKTDKKEEVNHAGEQNGEAKGKEDEAKVGEKRKADKKGDKMTSDNKEEKGKEVKKQKTNNEISQEAKKGPGRPKANGDKKPASKKEKKVSAVGKTERKTRSQGAA